MTPETTTARLKVFNRSFKVITSFRINDLDSECPKPCYCDFLSCECGYFGRAADYGDSAERDAAIQVGGDMGPNLNEQNKRRTVLENSVSTILEHDW